MKLVLTTKDGNCFTEKSICSISPYTMRSTRLMRDTLELHSCRIWGKEGRDWRISQNEHGHLIPFYAYSPRSGETLEFK